MRAWGSWSTERGCGEGLRWLQDHAGYSLDYCLIWPLSRDDKGYGIVSIDGKPRKVHRVMCEMVNGTPPTPTHEASHSCGRGHEACCNPRHLSWKTRAENQQDRREHGTMAHQTWSKKKLNRAQVIEIRNLKGIKTEFEIGQMFNISPTNVNKIHNGERWQNLYPSPQRERACKAIIAAGRPITIHELQELAEMPNLESAKNAIRKMVRDGDAVRVKHGWYAGPAKVASHGEELHK